MIYLRCRNQNAASKLEAGRVVDKWYCDSCGQVIESVDQGWVENLWKCSEGKSKRYGLRIVHYEEKCMYNDYEHFHRVPLSFYTGQDGLMQLLTLISDGVFENNDEILEVIKRIFIEDYEKARFHFEAAISEGYFEPNTKAGFYTESDIQRTMDYIKDESIN